MKILIAGDYYPRRRIQELLEKNDFSFLDEVKQFTTATDYSIVNFEGCVADADDKPIDKCGPNQRCKKNAVEAIKQAGFNCVTLANNHFYDFGDGGVAKTIQACNEYSIDYVGGGMSLEEAQTVLYKNIGSETLAIINVCETEFSIAADNHGGSAPLNLVQNYYAIQEAKKKADYVLLVVHGGIEVYSYPTPRMKETYRFFIDAGADAVVNHHQHCISGYEVYKGKPIIYGLGNFCFDWVTASVKWWEEGYLVMIDFKKQSCDYKLIPYMQFSKEPKVDFNVSYDVFMEEINEINKVIDDDKLLEEKLIQFSLAQNELLFFEPYNTRITKGLFRRRLLPSCMNHDKLNSLLDKVCCESNRDVLLTALIYSRKK